jgi:hypothetical protein
MGPYYDENQELAPVVDEMGDESGQFMSSGIRI